MITLAFRRDDPRRTELLGELPHIPRIERPFWVCEQLEVALFEGVVSRLVSAMQEVWRARRNPENKMLTGRSAGIIGASFLISVTAGVLTYLAVGSSHADLGAAFLAGGAAFASAIRLLNSVIA